VFLSGCSGDDGRPDTGPTGPGSGTGGGTGTGGGKGAGTGDNRQAQPTDPASSTSPTDPANAAKTAAAEGPCASNDECESGVCFVGGNQSYCSVKCTVDDAATSCVAPFTGSCNKQGYCKRD
jgi:hypothetical protein